MLSPHQLIEIYDPLYPLILSILFFFENIFLTQEFDKFIKEYNDHF
jgi:hypothetical protein